MTQPTRKDERAAIARAYEAMGNAVLFGTGGGWLREGGWRTLAQMRKETGVNMAQTRKPARYGGGDWAGLVMFTNACSPKPKGVA